MFSKKSSAPIACWRDDPKLVALIARREQLEAELPTIEARAATAQTEAEFLGARLEELEALHDAGRPIEPAQLQETRAAAARVRRDAIVARVDHRETQVELERLHVAIGEASSSAQERQAHALYKAWRSAAEGLAVALIEAAEIAHRVDDIRRQAEDAWPGVDGGDYVFGNRRGLISIGWPALRLADPRSASGVNETTLSRWVFDLAQEHGIRAPLDRLAKLGAAVEPGPDPSATGPARWHVTSPLEPMRDGPAGVA